MNFCFFQTTQNSDNGLKLPCLSESYSMSFFSITFGILSRLKQRKKKNITMFVSKRPLMMSKTCYSYSLTKYFHLWFTNIWMSASTSTGRYSTILHGWTFLHLWVSFFANYVFVPSQLCYISNKNTNQREYDDVL